MKVIDVTLVIHQVLLLVISLDLDLSETLASQVLWIVDIYYIFIVIILTFHVVGHGFALLDESSSTIELILCLFLKCDDLALGQTFEIEGRFSLEIRVLLSEIIFDIILLHAQLLVELAVICLADNMVIVPLESLTWVLLRLLHVVFKIVLPIGIIETLSLIIGHLVISLAHLLADLLECAT